MQYQVAHADRTDALIAVLREITLAHKAERSREERLGLIETLLEKDADQILAQCIAHEAVAGNKYLSFFPMPTAYHRGEPRVGADHLLVAIRL
jgi:hypothetical protein